MDLSLLARGLLLGFSIAAPVGPIGVLCIRRTLAESRAAGFVSGLGAATADALYGCVAAFGLTLVSSALLRGRVWMAWIGGLFLLWLGWRTLTSRPPELPGGTEGVAEEVPPDPGPGAGGAADRAARRSRSLWMAWVSTFLLTVTNPMTILSFAAVFAGLGLGSAARGPASAASLVAGVFLGSAAWWFALSGSVSLLKSRATPERLVWVNRISGIVLLGFGVAALFVASGALG